MGRKSLARVFVVALIALLSLVPAATVFAASPQQDVNPDLVGLWISEESDAGETVSISFFDDGLAQAESDFTDGSDSVLYGGSWADNGDDTVSVFIEEVDGESVGADPVEIAFDVVSDTELNAADTTDFGDDGMTITLEDSEPVAFVDEAAAAVDTAASSDVVTDTEVVTDVVVPGIYVTNDLVVDDIPGAALVYLNEDGSFQSVAANFDAESMPVTRLGTWEDNGDATITLVSDQEMTVTDGVVAFTDMDEPEELSFSVSGDVLEGKVLSLYRLGAVVDNMTGFASMVGDDMSANEAASDAEASAMTLYMSPMKDILAGTINVLVLQSDGIASFTSGSTADAEPVIEVGQWTEDADGIITVDLTQDDAGADLDEPSTIVFEPDADGKLVATDYDTDRYGDSIVLELTEDQ